MAFCVIFISVLDTSLCSFFYVHMMPERFENGRKFDGEKLTAKLSCRGNAMLPKND